jgi:hypothetical protein
MVAATAGAAAQPTLVTIYRPYSGAKVAPSLKITRTAKGECFSGSLADSRRDAWRCEIGSQISDPCFSSPAVASWVLCPEDGTPFGTTVVRLALSKSLPKSLGNKGSPGQGNPWTVRLASGKVCTFLTGATFAYHGDRVNYGCDRKTFLAGSPDRSHALWTITLGTGPKSAPRRAAIAEAAW